MTSIIAELVHIFVYGPAETLLGVRFSTGIEEPNVSEKQTL